MDCCQYLSIIFNYLTFLKKQTKYAFVLPLVNKKDVKVKGGEWRHFVGGRTDYICEIRGFEL